MEEQKRGLALETTVEKKTERQGVGKNKLIILYSQIPPRAKGNKMSGEKKLCLCFLQHSNIAGLGAATTNSVSTSSYSLPPSSGKSNTRFHCRFPQSTVLFPCADASSGKKKRRKGSQLVVLPALSVQRHLVASKSSRKKDLYSVSITPKGQEFIRDTGDTSSCALEKTTNNTTSPTECVALLSDWKRASTFFD